MSLSKKDYETIAAILHSSKELAGANCAYAITLAAFKLSAYFEEQSPRFNKKKFEQVVLEGLPPII